MKPSELLEDPSAWCQLEGAMNAQGQPCNTQSPNAVRWAIDGALDRCTTTQEEYDLAVSKVVCALGKDAWSEDRLVDWNDDPDRTHKEVIEVLRKAGL